MSDRGSELKDNLPRHPESGAIPDNFVYKSRIAAAALALFAGAFGFHRFFLGQWWGLFYLLFCWTYIPWLVGIIEGIIFLATSQKDWNKKYNQGISAGTEKGTVVVVFACLLPLIAVFGILAAVALPAYQDYTIRAKLTESHLAAATLKSAVEDYVHSNQEWPKDIDQLQGFQPPQSENISAVEIENGVIIVYPSIDLNISGELIYVPTASDVDITWSCTDSTIEDRHLPPECR